LHSTSEPLAASVFRWHKKAEINERSVLLVGPCLPQTTVQM